MLTTAEAAQVLTRAGRSKGPPLAELLRLLGFRPALRVPRSAARRLSIDPRSRASIADGAGSLRALVVESIGTTGLRDEVLSVARAVTRASPELLWLIIARDAARGALLIVTPPPGSQVAMPALTVDCRRVLESDAETFAALSSARDEPDSLLHFRWREILGRDGLTHRFYRDFEQCVATLADTATGCRDAADRRTIAVLHASRLLFLAFLEAKGLLDADRAFLRQGFEARCGGRGAHRRFLDPLFFGTLNTRPSKRAPAARAFGRVPFLNGGLFTRTPVESRARDLRFTDAALGALIGDLLGRYRLTARETSAAWSEAAVDPEMLGRAFESLMGNRERKAGGVFYTPQTLIVRLTRQALDASIRPLETLRVLDPACGSGAFLVFALEEIADRLAAGGDPRPLSAIRRDVLVRGIFGVDRDPTAVWLCQLRLWLSVVVEDELADGEHLLPLPNLDRNIREGDALAGTGFDDTATISDGPIETLRLRYARANGVRKRSLGAALDAAERRRAVRAADERVRRARAERLDLLASLRSPDLFSQRSAPEPATRRHLEALRADARAALREARRLRDGGALPFAFSVHFPALAERNGVDLTLGNPPWVRTQRIPLADRSALRARFESFRDAAWQAGAQAAAAGRGFASQADLAALFTERAVRLTRPGGVIALLLPAKLWTALAGGGVRQILAREAPPLAVEIWEDDAGGFDAAVYPSALLAQRTPTTNSPPRDEAPVEITRHHAGDSASWTVHRDRLTLENTPGAPWLLLPEPVRRAFDALTEAGSPLAESRFGRPLLGVKTGCNAAFLVRCVEETPDGRLVRVIAGKSTGVVEQSVLRPVLRGEHLQPFVVPEASAREAILWTHGPGGATLAELPPAARRWLQKHRRSLEKRSDGRSGPWWALFRVEGAQCDLPRVVWCDIGRSPRAAVLAAGDPSVPLNTCYVVRAPTSADACALAALMNSAPVTAWLRAIAEPARGGYRRFLGWTVARLPLPRDWDRARRILAPFGEAARDNRDSCAPELTAAVCESYRLDLSILAPLLEWERR